MSFPNGTIVYCFQGAILKREKGGKEEKEKGERNPETKNRKSKMLSEDVRD